MKVILTIFLKFITFAINLCLTPLNLLVEQLIPNTSDLSSIITSFINWLRTFVLWVCSWLPFTSEFYAIIVSVIIFRYTIPLLASGIKLVVKWWHALAP